jgi:hypothetical protein
VDWASLTRFRVRGGRPCERPRRDDAHPYRRTWPLPGFASVVLAFLVINSVSAPAATAARPTRELSANQLLARAQSFAASATSVQLQSNERDELRQRPGAHADVTNIEYQLQVLPLAGRVHMYVSGPGGVAEVTVANEGACTRQAKTRDGLTAQRWDVMTLDQFLQQTGSAGSNSVLAQPTNVASILKTLRSPTVLARGSGQRCSKPGSIPLGSRAVSSAHQRHAHARVRGRGNGHPVQETRPRDDRGGP